MTMPPTIRRGRAVGLYLRPVAGKIDVEAHDGVKLERLTLQEDDLVLVHLPRSMSSEEATAIVKNFADVAELRGLRNVHFLAVYEGVELEIGTAVERYLNRIGFARRPRPVPEVITKARGELAEIEADLRTEGS